MTENREEDENDFDDNNDDGDEADSNADAEGKTMRCRSPYVALWQMRKNRQCVQQLL